MSAFLGLNSKVHQRGVEKFDTGSSSLLFQHKVTLANTYFFYEVYY